MYVCYKTRLLLRGCFRAEKNLLCILAERFSCSKPVKDYSQITVKNKVIKKDSIIPPIQPGLLSDNTIVSGFHYRRKLITWITIQGQNKVLHWLGHYIDFVSPDLYTILRAAAEVNQHIAPSDIYVMEENLLPKTDMRKVIESHIQIAQFNSVLMSLLAARTKSSAIPMDWSNIYIMKPRITAAHFSLSIGKDVITTDYIVRPILKKLEIDPQLVKTYNSKNSLEKEEMGWALLKTLAFIDMNYLKKESKAEGNNIYNIEV